MELNGDDFVVRPWRRGDEDALVRHANNRKIWRNLTDIFPYPYTPAHAEDWISKCIEGRAPIESLAVEIGGEAVGSIGGTALDDVRAHTWVLGYWLGESHWGKGHATRIVCRYVDWLFQQKGVERAQAFVFSWNPASARVLEKSGFQLEGCMRRAIFKDGEYCDELRFGRLKSDPVPPA